MLIGKICILGLILSFLQLTFVFLSLKYHTQSCVKDLIGSYYANPEAEITSCYLTGLDENSGEGAEVHFRVKGVDRQVVYQVGRYDDISRRGEKITCVQPMKQHKKDLGQRISSMSQEVYNPRYGNEGLDDLSSGGDSYYDHNY